MGDLVPFDLEVGERVHEVRGLIEGDTLVHDGNSRWVEFGDKRYLVVNENYLAPEDDAS